MNTLRKRKLYLVDKVQKEIPKMTEKRLLMVSIMVISLLLVLFLVGSYFLGWFIFHMNPESDYLMCYDSNGHLGKCNEVHDQTITVNSKKGEEYTVKVDNLRFNKMAYFVSGYKIVMPIFLVGLLVSIIAGSIVILNQRSKGKKLIYYPNRRENV